jgi:hypothetical protein
MGLELPPASMVPLASLLCRMGTSCWRVVVEVDLRMGLGLPPALTIPVVSQLYRMGT